MKKNFLVAVALLLAMVFTFPMGLNVFAEEAAETVVFKATFPEDAANSPEEVKLVIKDKTTDKLYGASLKKASGYQGKLPLDVTHEYEVSADPIDGFESVVTGDLLNGYNVVFSAKDATGETIMLPVRAVFQSSVPASKLPSSVVVRVIPNGVEGVHEEVELSKAQNYETKVDIVNADSYTVQIVPVQGLVGEVEGNKEQGYVIIFAEDVSTVGVEETFPVKVHWILPTGSSIPADVTLKLYDLADPEMRSDLPISADENWEKTVKLRKKQQIMLEAEDHELYDVAVKGSPDTNGRFDVFYWTKGDPVPDEVANYDGADAPAPVENEQPQENTQQQFPSTGENVSPIPFVVLGIAAVALIARLFVGKK